MAMGMKRPAWTLCFGVVWLLLLIAVIMMHAALGKVNPAIQDFPANLVKGFMEVFGFNDLQALARSVETQSTGALNMCSFTPSTTACGLYNPTAECQLPAGQQTVDTSTYKNAIVAAFANGLKKIETVGNDKYFGTPDLASAAGNIGTIETEMDKIPAGSTQCCVVVPVYCEIYKSAETLDSSYNSIKAEIDKLTTGDAIDSFNKGAENLKYLHILPWILVLSTVFFGCMWFKNGACCCCSNGSFMWCCLVSVPQAITWLLAFILMTIFTGIGFAFGPVVLNTELPDFKGNPTVGTLLDHIQAAFPRFWEIVFEELVSGLDTFRTASTIFVVICMIIVVYSCCFCCCRPYGVGDKANEGGQV